MTVAGALRHGAEMLSAAGVESPRLEARLLLAHAAGLRQDALLRDRDAPVEMAPYAVLLARRAAREPLALITGRQEFWSLSLAVSGDTLIPRPDSETLIEAALAARPDRAGTRSILDLGTGTGCLLLAALTEYPAAWGIGVDLSPGAAALARRNAAALGLSSRAAVLCACWDDALHARFDLVLSNPPYIPGADIAGLMPEVALHEPRRALDGGPDGLDAYRALLRRMPALLQPGGTAVLELGAGQAAAVSGLAEGWVVGLRRDLGGIERAIVLRRPGDA